MNTAQSKNNFGFTMIELLVAIGIFGILLIIVSGVFSRFMLIERHGIAEGQLISDLRSAMESFTKEARTGYGSTYNVSSDGKEVVFRNQDGDCVAYRIATAGTSGVFQRADLGPSISSCDPGIFTGKDSKFSPLTGSSTDISSIHFNAVIPQVAGGRMNQQGVVTVSVTASSAVSDVQPIQFENSITSRQMAPYVQN